MTHLLLKDGQLYADIDGQQLPVINGEIAFLDIGESEDWVFAEGDLYPWNGGAEVEERKVDFNVLDGWDYEKVVRLSLPDNKENSAHSYTEGSDYPEPECEKPITADRVYKGNNGWISVKDQMPEFGRWLLTFTWRGIVIASYFNDGFYALQINTPGIKMEVKDVSHWMPLPNPPIK